jgi:hypothetical protein
MKPPGGADLARCRDRRGAVRCQTLEIQNGAREFYRRVPRPALLLAGVLINRDR